jgi:hypothetical protein
VVISAEVRTPTEVSLSDGSSPVRSSPVSPESSAATDPPTHRDNLTHKQRAALTAGRTLPPCVMRRSGAWRGVAP